MKGGKQTEHKIVITDKQKKRAIRKAQKAIDAIVELIEIMGNIDSLHRIQDSLNDLESDIENL